MAIDDTLFQRTGPKVHAIGWFHDGSAKGPKQVVRGNNWVIAAIIVRLPFCSRPVALPALARLVHKDIKPAPASRLALARQMTAALACALPGRQVHVVADAACAGKELRRLPASVTWTTRLRQDAALHELAPPHTGKRGRPRVRGARLPKLAALAGQAVFAPVTVHRYGKDATVQAAAITCLRHGVLGARPVQVIRIRDRAAASYDLALATTDLAASPSRVLERYAARWSVEVAIEDAKQILGAGQARNRLPSTADMIAKLRRILIAARYRPGHPGEPTPAEIHAVRLAWDGAAA